jgi:hypothetical protein
VSRFKRGIIQTADTRLLAIPLIVRTHQLSFEGVILGESNCAAAFTLTCSGKITENLNGTGYRSYLQLREIGDGRRLKIPN